MARLQNRFGELLARKERIEGHRFTLRQLAKITGLSLSSVHAWKNNGIQRFDGTAVVALCKFLDCSVSDLLIIEGSDEDTESNTPLAVAV